MNNKSQAYILTGVALLIIGAILLYVSVTSPRVYDNVNVQSTTEQEYYSFSDGEDEMENSFPINLNTATVEDLQRIDGIGESKAKNIVAYREANGNFTSVEELMNIDGIGDKLFEKISPYLTV